MNPDDLPNDAWWLDGIQRRGRPWLAERFIDAFAWFWYRSWRHR